MKFVDVLLALEIIRECDSLTITEEDKKVIIAVFGNIIKPLRETGLITTEISAMYAVLKNSTWNDGYFCVVTRKMCSILQHIISLYAPIFDH